MNLDGVWKCRNGLYVKVMGTIGVNQFGKQIPYNKNDGLTLTDNPEWDLMERFSQESKEYQKAMEVLEGC